MLSRCTDLEPETPLGWWRSEGVRRRRGRGRGEEKRRVGWKGERWRAVEGGGEEGWCGWWGVS
ncbi:MAG: hypothetical protein ACKESB_02055 [Candidatus Hodgkinia cicadicola]